MYRVLCVEDEAGFREDVADYLRMQSFEVEEAANGREALQKLEISNYDVILSDIKMPEMDGFGMFRALPKDAPPVVFLSALSDYATLVEGHELGCEEFLTKPVNFKVMLAALEHRIKARVLHHETDERTRYHSTRLMLANCVQHVLSKPLLQISEAAYYLTSLPEDAPISRVRSVLDLVKDASNKHLAEMGLLQAGVAIPEVLPDTVPYVTVNDTFLRMAVDNVPQLHAEAISHIAVEELPQMRMQPDWLVRSYTELLSSYAATQNLGLDTVPRIVMDCQNSWLTITYVDGKDLFSDNIEYTSLDQMMREPSICESLAGRMLALIYTHAVALAHGGSLAVKYYSPCRLAVQMQLPISKPN